MSDLSERLVKAALDQTLPDYDRRYFTMKERIYELKDTKAAVAAVLRELAASEEWQLRPRAALTELADEIEPRS